MTYWSTMPAATVTMTIAKDRVPRLTSGASRPRWKTTEATPTAMPPSGRATQALRPAFTRISPRKAPSVISDPYVMLRMLLIPNWTEKPTAPSAITAPAATPNPTAWISVWSTPQGASADELEHLGAGDRANRGASAPVGVEDARGEVPGG